MDFVNRYLALRKTDKTVDLFRNIEDKQNYSIE